MINEVSHLYSNWVLNKPKLILLILSVILIFLSTSIPNFKLDASADSLILENDRDLKTYREMLRRYQTKDFLVMTFTPNSGEVFDENNLNLLANLKNQLMEIEGVDSITSLIDVPLVKSSDLSFTEMISDVPTIFSPSVNQEKARDEVLNSPIYKDLIISQDARTTALQINIKNNKNLDELILKRTALVEKEMFGSMDAKEKVMLSETRKKYEAAKTKYDLALHNLLENIRSVKKSYEHGHNLSLIHI